MNRLLFVALLLPGCGLWDTPAIPAPSDKFLFAEFHDHRAQIDQVIAMAKEDSHLVRIDSYSFSDASGYSTEPDPPLLTTARHDEYRRLFRELRLKNGITITPAGIFFLRSTSGLGISGSSKGYALLTAPPDLLCQNTDSPPPQTKPGDITCYRRIEGSWYIFHDWTS